MDKTDLSIRLFELERERLEIMAILYPELPSYNPRLTRQQIIQEALDAGTVKLTKQ